MTRSEWLKLNDQNLPRASFIAFTSEQKFQFWQDKIKEILKLNWNKEERNHILKLQLFLNDHSGIFKEEYFKNQNIQDEFDKFFYLWNEGALEKLGWNKILV